MTRIPLLVLQSLHLHEYAGVVLVSKALIGTHAPEPADAKAKQVCIGSYRYTYMYMHYTNDASVSIKKQHRHIKASCPWIFSPLVTFVYFPLVWDRDTRTERNGHRASSSNTSHLESRHPNRGPELIRQTICASSRPRIIEEGCIWALNTDRLFFVLSLSFSPSLSLSHFLSVLSC